MIVLTRIGEKKQRNVNFIREFVKIKKLHISSEIGSFYNIIYTIRNMLNQVFFLIYPA